MKQHSALQMCNRDNFMKRIRLPVLLAVSLLFYRLFLRNLPSAAEVDRVLAQCQSISVPAGPQASYNAASRVVEGSDRYDAETAPTLIQNARIWTGASNGTDFTTGDILLDKGLIMGIGHIPRDVLAKVKGGSRIETIDARGRWVTPGLVDLHSHLGLSSAPYLKGEC